MRPLFRLLRTFGLLVLLACVAAPAAAQVPHPADVFGFEPGADYHLADYGQMVDYYRRLDAASDRVQLVEIGESVQGRPLLLVYVSSAENLQRLERWRMTSERLARARIAEDEARLLAREGRAIVWIDGGLHATEVAGAQMTPLLAYRVATEETPEMQRIRDGVVLLLMPVMNPDGLDIVAGWYRRNRGTPFETTAPPWLYHVYAGHDNNRDWFMNNLPETAAVSEVLYRQWFPQIVVNHHQSAPAWARIFVPPFADPVNPRIHPGVTTAVNMLGSAMANRFAMEGMPGVVSGKIYSMWWNGGMRTVPYFHNMVGILTEVAHASASPRRYDPQDRPETVAGLRTDATQVFYADPWEGGESRLRDAVDYMITGSMAVLHTAAALREDWLFNIYRMGRDAIAAGTAAAPYAYVIPSEQPDPGEAANLVNLLLLGGVEVHRAVAPFEAGGRRYEGGAYVLYAAQAFRPYLVDLMERQDYPDRRRYPGGPPEAPYDLAGWTLPLQMGVRVDSVGAAFALHAAPVTEPVAAAPGVVRGEGAYGYAIARRANASVAAVNRLLTAGERVVVAADTFAAGGGVHPAGTFVVARGRETEARVRALARDLGLDVAGLAEAPPVPVDALRLPRVGLYKSWVANADEGWTRWLLDAYAFPVDTLHDADIRAGVNAAGLGRYDAIVLPDQRPAAIRNGHAPGTMPPAYVGGLGTEGSAALKRYVEQGGTLVAFDDASDYVIEQFGLPLRNVVDGVDDEQFFVPGSLLHVEVDTRHPYGFGMADTAAVVFTRSRAFDVVVLPQKREGGEELRTEAPASPVEVVARYVEDDPLASGWALGAQEHLGGKAALVRVPVGEGSVVLFGFRPQFRGQPRGTYKLVFNALHAATADRPSPEAE